MFSEYWYLYIVFFSYILCGLGIKCYEEFYEKDFEEHVPEVYNQCLSNYLACII